MQKLKGNLILLCCVLALLSCSHMPQTYPPPDVSVQERQDKPESIEPAITQENKQTQPEANQTNPENNQEPAETEKDALGLCIDDYDEYLIGAEEEIHENKDASGKTASISSLPTVKHAKTQGYIEKALGKDRNYYISVLNRFEKVRPRMEAIFEEQGLPKDLVYLAFIESGGNPNAVSPSGAVGYWQFLPGTARSYGLKIDRWVDERKDLDKSTRAAARYLTQLYKMFDDWLLACAAYNAGEMAIDRILKNNSDVKTFWDISPGMIYKYETIAFVPKILAAIEIGNNRDKYDIPRPIDPEPLSYDIVNVDSYATFEQVAVITGCSISSVAALNPELKRKCTPPYAKDYRLKVPEGKGELVASGLKQGKNLTEQYASYAVQKGDTLFSIAKRHGTTVERISAFNKIGNKDNLALGTVLIIPEDIYLRQSEKHTLASKDFRTHKDTFSQEEYAKGEDDIDTSLEKKKVGYTKIPSIKNSPNKIRYNVKKGDTIWKISRRYNVSEKDIKKWNQLNAASSIHPGDKLTIYLKEK